MLHQNKVKVLYCTHDIKYQDMSYTAVLTNDTHKVSGVSCKMTGQKPDVINLMTGQEECQQQVALAEQLLVAEPSLLDCQRLSSILCMDNS